MSESNELFNNGIFKDFDKDKNNNINKETKKLISKMALSIYNDLSTKIDINNEKIDLLDKQLEELKCTNNNNYKNIINGINNLNSKIDNLDNKKKFK